jgi:hypothetical protein
MSPEQGRGDTSIDARTDVWSLGIVLFETLSGAPPFDAPNYNLLILKILTERPPRLESFAPAVPAELANIVHRAIEPDREQRYPSMRAFLDALLTYAASRGDLSIASPPTGPVANPQLSASSPSLGVSSGVRVAPSYPPAADVPPQRVPQRTEPLGSPMLPVPVAPPTTSLPPTAAMPATPSMMGQFPLGPAPSMRGAAPVGVDSSLPIPSGGVSLPPASAYPAQFGTLAGPGAPLRPQETSLGWAQNAPAHPPSRAGRFALIALACFLALGISIAAFRGARRHHHAAPIVVPTTRIALAPPQTPIAVASTTPAVIAPSAATPNAHAAPASPTTALANTLGNPTSPPSTATPTPPATAPTPAAPAPTATTHAAPAPHHAAPNHATPTMHASTPATQPHHAAPAPVVDPVVQQSRSVAQQLQYAAQQYASADPRRSNRMYTQSVRLQQETDQLAALETQARALANVNPDAAAQLRGQADRQRERVQRLMMRFVEDAQR